MLFTEVYLLQVARILKMYRKKLGSYCKFLTKQRRNFSKECFYLHVNFGTDDRSMGSHLAEPKGSRWKIPYSRTTCIWVLSQIVENRSYKQCMENQNDTAKNFEFLILLG